MEINDVDSTTIITIWNDIKEFGTGFWVFILLLNMYWLKNQWISFIKELCSIITFKTFRKRKSIHYSKKDILKHRLFKDIDYWLAIGIPALQIKSRHHSTEEQDYIDNKERMAKELFRIKLEINKEYFKKFVEEVDFDNIDMAVCGSYFQDCITKINITQKQKFIERGISPKFLNKYYVSADISEQIINASIKTIFERMSDMDTSTKAYISLNIIDAYLNIIYGNILETIDSINGDLKGEIFDGEPMCRAYHSVIKPPHPTYPMIVKEKLEAITNEFNGARALVIKYYEKDNTDYHSAVYEYSRNGVTSEMSSIQQINDDLERNVYNIMKEHGTIATDISKFGQNTIERLNNRGVKAIIISPIINDNNIDGALVIDYIAKGAFDEVIKDKELDSKVKKFAESLAPYIVYPKNYEF